MAIISSEIEELGFGQWFQDHIDSEDWNRIAIARVMAAHKDSYTVNTGRKDTFAELIGANIDVAFMVKSLDSNFNLRRLER